MAEIVLLNGTKTQADSESTELIIKSLERYIGYARDGRISGIAFAAIYSDGDLENLWVGTASYLSFVSAASRLLHCLNKAIDEHNA